MTKRRVIKHNRAKCKLCLEIIESENRHDYVTCKCGEVSVDGGKDYLKRSGRNLDNVLELSEYEEIEVNDSE